MNNILALNPPSILRPLAIRWKFNLKALWLLSFSLVAFLVVFQIFQINEITKASFLISTQEKQLAGFSQESQRLNANFSHLNSLTNLETLLNNLNYVEVGQVHYLRVPGSTVVAK